MPRVVDGPFEWDSAKEQENIGKHGISFAQAKSLFRKTSLRRAAKVSPNERREMFIGEPHPPVNKLSGHQDNVWKVIFTIKVDSGGIRRFRIISCHDANAGERAAYRAFSS
ncbi:BrnT family toxin [Paracoccus sp. SY]|uniref:BrnT family toxin n=1 Tax=Paracoccus sp. SY TaxID=1330255 RepID=UPI001304A6B8